MKASQRRWVSEMELSREILDRFVDGELPPKEMEHVAEALASHPDLNAYVQRQEYLRTQLRARFLELDGALPERLIVTAWTAPISWQWRLRALLKRGGFVRWLVPTGAALLLGLVIGVGVRPQGNLGADASGQVIAQGALRRTLDTQLAAAGPGPGPAQIGVSFRNKVGEDCRTFASSESAGLACHRAGVWVVETLVGQTPEDAGATYHMAGSEIPDAVRRAVIASMDGEPFDAAAEARARDKGWSGR